MFSAAPGRRSLVIALLAGSCCSLMSGQKVAGAAASGPLASLRQEFATPPMDARPMMRWWWFGPAVEKDELARELQTMKAGGIGGIEIQPVYPLALDDPEK